MNMDTASALRHCRAVSIVYVCCLSVGFIELKMKHDFLTLTWRGENSVIWPHYNVHIWVHTGYSSFSCCSICVVSFSEGQTQIEKWSSWVCGMEKIARSQASFFNFQMIIFKTGITVNWCLIEANWVVSDNKLSVELGHFKALYHAVPKKALGTIYLEQNFIIILCNGVDPFWSCFAVWTKARGVLRIQCTWALVAKWCLLDLFPGRRFLTDKLKFFCAEYRGDQSMVPPIIMQELAGAEHMLPDNISVFMQMADRQLWYVCLQGGRAWARW